MDASSLELQFNESLLNSLQSSKHSQASTLHVLQIITIGRDSLFVGGHRRSVRGTCDLQASLTWPVVGQPPGCQQPATTRSQAALADHKERLTSLHSLPVTELVRLAEVNPEVKLARVVVRRMAQDKVTSIISSKTLEVSLCSASLEGLIFLIWRHLEHFLLYSGAPLAAGQHTPIQEAYSNIRQY